MKMPVFYTGKSKLGSVKHFSNRWMKRAWSIEHQGVGKKGNKTQRMNEKHSKFVFSV